MEWIASWQFWTIVMILMLIVSASIGDITLVAVALAAAAAAVGAYLDFGIYTQLAIFAVVASLLGPLFYVMFRAARRTPDIENIGAGGAMGTEATVIVKHDKPGIMIDNHFYPVRRENNDPLDEGEQVVVQRIAGITAIVTLRD